MSKETGVILLGIFVAALPFLGFPQAMRDVFYILSGLGLLTLGFFLRADHLKREAKIDIHQGNASIEDGQKKISDIAPAE